jgi:hypothetical protein
VPGRIAYDNLRAAVVRILVGGERAPTARSAALASRYLVEPCFCRPGEGHDNGVDGRGKAVRCQALVPIPSAPTLAGINQALLAGMDARLDMGRDVTGQTMEIRFVEETKPVRSCRSRLSPRRPPIGTVSSRALVRLEGAGYSVPCGWAGLDLIGRGGAAKIPIIGRDETQITHARKRFGQRSIDYRHYLPELRASRRRCAKYCPICRAILARHFPRSGTISTSHRPRDAAPSLRES